MLNILDNNKTKFLSENLLNNIYLMPKWEKIKTFSILQNTLFFKKENYNVDLFRKFSSKNMLEKYLIKSQDNLELANMDLKIYKDCVYIINLNIKNKFL